MPLRDVKFTELGFQRDFLNVCKNPREKLQLDPDTIFLNICKFLSKNTISNSLFLFSDFGWSVSFDTYGDKDPAYIRPELIHIQKGTPINTRSVERKTRIQVGQHRMCGPFNRNASDIHNRSPITRGHDYTPSATASAAWTEYWSTSAQAFEHSMYFRVAPKAEWSRHGLEPFQVLGYCGHMQLVLWQTFSTDACEHALDNPPKSTKLGPDAAAIMGWISDQKVIQSVPERILIFLTKGEPRIRWLATKAAVVFGRDPNDVGDGHVREIMLCTHNCCDACALEQAAALPGYWTLIL